MIYVRLINVSFLMIKLIAVLSRRHPCLLLEHQHEMLRALMAGEPGDIINFELGMAEQPFRTFHPGIGYIV